MDAAAARAASSRTRTESPAPSPHGAIGEFPVGIGGPPAPGPPAPGGSGSTSSVASSTAPRRSSSLARPRTPQGAGGGNDEIDLTALIAQGQRQFDLDGERDRGRFGAGRFGMPMPAGVGTAATRADSPSRWDDDQWRGRSSSMRRQTSTHSATGGSITPTASGLSGFFEQPFPSPIGARPARSSVKLNSAPPAPAPGAVAAPVDPRNGAGNSTEPAAAAAHHLQALTALLGPLSAQTEEIHRLRAEVELWRGEWQRCDRERRRLEAIVSAKSSEPIQGSPFSVVLIDGDGLIFQDEHLRKGFAGGQQAARALVASLPKLAGGVFVSTSSAPSPRSDSTDEAPTHELGAVVVNVFVNKSGLGHALLRAGSIPSWSVYDAFWLGFSAAHDLFSVIDVGHGKEATDAKVREHLKLYTSNRQCGTIFLGASHDNSYTTVLQSLETTTPLMSKLVILKGYSDLAHGLKQYADRAVTVPDLFRTTRLEKVVAAHPMNGAPSPTSPTAPAAVKGLRQRRGVPPPSPLAAAPPPPPPTVTPAVPEVEEGASSHEEEAQATASDNESEPDVQVIEWDSLGHPPLTPQTPGWPSRGSGSGPSGRGARPTSARANNNLLATPGEEEDGDWEDGKKKGKKYKPATRAASIPTVRNLKPRPCHTFYLSPWGCKNGDGCEYAHHYKLNEEQTEELARLAKEIICPYVRTKRCHFSEDECVYGHRCPRGERCTFGETCRFKDLPNGHGEADAAAAAARG
ncbi:uncharacterized protein LOC62_01G000537 [Vanrija pseudolonga]|uniref:C3H1-type domain-containing protein n=1 Tax=Vanrija pseudolonga TaxID=143232 RepID=A0AAF0Y2J6_9TREE|nr:hypothetical protein LOC62_01G000537 [Vanrija pseudolonga]